MLLNLSPKILRFSFDVYEVFILESRLLVPIFHLGDELHDAGGLETGNISHLRILKYKLVYPFLEFFHRPLHEVKDEVDLHGWSEFIVVVDQFGQRHQLHFKTFLYLTERAHIIFHSSHHFLSLKAKSVFMKIFFHLFVLNPKRVLINFFFFISHFWITDWRLICADL